MIAYHKAVRERANYTCEVCKRVFPENELCSHHIKSKGAYPNLKYDLANGLCVCFACHYGIHNGSIKVDPTC